ncbi:MAG: hypothetical protein WC976_07190 [Caldisericia bacterium]
MIRKVFIVLFLLLIIKGNCICNLLLNDMQEGAESLSLGGNWVYPTNNGVINSPGVVRISVAADTQKTMDDYAGRVRLSYPLSSSFAVGYSFLYRQINIERWDENNVNLGYANYPAVKNTIAAGLRLSEVGETEWMPYLAIALNYYIQKSVVDAFTLDMSFASTKESKGTGIYINNISNKDVPIDFMLSNRFNNTYAGLGFFNKFFYLSIGQSVTVKDGFKINAGARYSPKAYHFDFNIGSFIELNAFNLSFNVSLFAPVTEVITFTTEYRIGSIGEVKKEENTTW